MKGILRQGILLIFGGVLLLLANACEEDPAFLLASQRTRIDTISANQIKLLRPELDSLCDEQFDALIKQAQDSIMETRMKEIKKILNK